MTDDSIIEDDNSLTLRYENGDLVRATVNDGSIIIEMRHVEVASKSSFIVLLPEEARLFRALMDRTK